MTLHESLLGLAGLIFVVATILLVLVPFAWIKDGKEMAASGVITSLVVGAVGVPLYLGGLVA